MNKLNLKEAFAEFKELKNVDVQTLTGVLEDVLHHAIEKQYGVDENDETFSVIINPTTGDFEIWQNRIVVADEEFNDPVRQISYTEMQSIDPSMEVGEEWTSPVQIETFGRRAILSLRQNLASKFLDLEKAELVKEYQGMLGEIVSGEIYQVWKREVMLMDDDDNELVIPKAEQIPNDIYRKGDTIKAIVKEVLVNNNQPKIILSRTANKFLERLFEAEVPEIADGLITIKAIARIPGERAKIAVESYDERIDPVGSCVGVRGSRIATIVKELRNENIDVINYATNPALFIQRALSPAKIELKAIEIDEQSMTAKVTLKQDQVSLAIGKGGLNIRLAKMLTGYDIDVFRETNEEDVALVDFEDEIEGWIIEALKSAGCDTAKSVLELSDEEVAARADLELSQVAEVKKILKAEFED